MFADTITLTDIHGTDDYVLTRVRQDEYSSEYRLITDTRICTIKIRNTTFVDKKRQNVVMDQHNVEVVEEVFAVAPATLSIVRKAFFTFQVQRGDVLSMSKGTALALVDWLALSSGANLTKMMNFES
jgi:hypothetical protein